MVPAPHVVEIRSYHKLSFVYVVTPSWNSPSHQLRGQKFLQVTGFTFAMFLHDIIMIFIGRLHRTRTTAIRSTGLVRQDRQILTNKDK